MKVYGALEAAQLEWFTDAGKPAASSYQYRVIYITDTKQVLVSDGTNWNPVNARFVNSVDSTATGTSAVIANGTSNLITLTNASLASVSSLSAPASGLICVLVNKTGVSVSINDEDTVGTAANRIRTGTGAPISVANNSSVYLIYVANDSRWHVVGGVGSGASSGSNFITNSNAEADTTGWATYAESDAVTFQDTGDTVTLNSHGLGNNAIVSFTVITSTTGISVNTAYYVVNATTNTFQLASSVGGTALALTTNGSGTMVRFSPKTGTGGSANITFTRTTNAPLIGTASFLFSKDAVNRQGQGASYDFTIDSAYTSKVLQISFEYAVGSGTFAAGTASTDSDITVWIYDKTNNVVIQPTNYKLYASSAQSNSFLGYFQAYPNSTSYRLIVHAATVSASQYSLKMDAVTVAPQVNTLGALRAPVGTIIATGSLTPPMGYLYADGTAVSRTQYANLFAAIGTTYGSGDGSTTFNIPNLKGIFARGAGSQTIGGITYSATLGTAQGDTMQGHIHSYYGSNSTGTGSNSLVVQTSQNGPFTGGVSTPATDGTNGTPRTGSETRPANQALAYHICFDSGTVAISSSIDYDYAEIGTIHPYAGTSVTAPTGFLFCDGSAVSRTTYADLYSIIGTAHGTGDGSTTFNLPDYRGRFLRGVTTDAGRDPDYTTRTAMNTGGNTGGLVGSIQGDAYRAHYHRTTTNQNNGNLPYLIQGGSLFGSDVGQVPRTTTEGGNETRPINANVQYIIRHAKGVVPAAIAASETVACYYDSGGLQVNIPNNSITTCTVFTNKIFDTHNAFSAGGTFTAPTSGTYSVSGGFQFGINATGLRAFYAVGPTASSILGYIAPSSTVANMCNGATLIKLNAGQQILIKAFQNSGGLLANSTDSAGNYVSIVRVGN